MKRLDTITLRDVSLGYAGKPLLERLDAGFGWGELTGLVGRNGAGKSTLLRTIAGLQKPLGGEILINGLPLAQLDARARASLIGFVSTERVLVDNLRVADVVALGRTPYTNWLGTLTAADHEQVARSLQLVGMEAFAQKDIQTLSDGERQRVMIARALAQDTPIILLDEPTAFLDLPNKYEICMLLRSLAHEQGKTIFFSTHDLTIALEFCDMLALVEGGALRLAAAGQFCFDTETLSVRLKNFE